MLMAVELLDKKYVNFCSEKNTKLSFLPSLIIDFTPNKNLQKKRVKVERQKIIHYWQRNKANNYKGKKSIKQKKTAK